MECNIVQPVTRLGDLRLAGPRIALRRGPCSGLRQKMARAMAPGRLGPEQAMQSFGVGWDP